MTVKTFKQGPFEKEFRKVIKHLIIHNLNFNFSNIIEHHKLRLTFKSIVTKLFLKYHYHNTVVLNRKDLREILTEKIWEEFYDIAKNKDIETAICIIFKRYEK